MAFVAMPTETLARLTRDELCERLAKLEAKVLADYAERWQRGQAEIERETGIKYLTAEEAADMYGVAPITVHRWIDEQAIPGVKINGAIRYRAQVLELWRHTGGAAIRGSRRVGLVGNHPDANSHG